MHYCQTVEGNRLQTLAGENWWHVISQKTSENNSNAMCKLLNRVKPVLLKWYVWICPTKVNSLATFSIMCESYGWQIASGCPVDGTTAAA